MQVLIVEVDPSGGSRQRLGDDEQGPDFDSCSRGFLQWIKPRGRIVMKRLTRLFVSALVPAFILAGAVAQPAIAQDKAKDTKAAQAEKGKATTKILLENDKVQVYETTFKPGDEGTNVERPYRIIRVLTGGTLLRTYPDGKTEKIVEKTGEARESGPDPIYTPKNIGKTTIHVYVVALKQAK